MDEYDVCYECSADGDDYYTDENGELQCWCDQCPFNPCAADPWDE